ncbi:hypothetical protein ACYG9R_09210 [Mesorhizobium sp. RSR565B]|uniref:hypothetical protein n=1 Tax=Mesorhizobium sp. L103C565B0 TaxID=1287094 RepID=UPI0004CE68CB|nr:hypothetical protein [Mesorhizobium sp. L103C565B0]
MREYSKISPKVWRSPRFRSLEMDDSRLFYLFLLSCEHQSSAGCFRLPDAYAAADLNWSVDRLETARAPLVGDFIVHDAATFEYFIARWFRHNPTTNVKHRQGVRRLISELDSDLVREAAEIELEEHEESKNVSASASIALSGANDRLAGSQFLNGRRA